MRYSSTDFPSSFAAVSCLGMCYIENLGVEYIQCSTKIGFHVPNSNCVHRLVNLLLEFDTDFSISSVALFAGSVVR